MYEPDSQFTLNRIGNRVAKKILEIIDLYVEFHSLAGVVHAVNGVSFSMEKGEIMGIVGESGSGKSVTALSIMGLLPQLFAKVPKGEILLDGRNLLDVSEREMRKIRGNRISMIFQEPMTSLNPILTCGNQVAESLRLHRGLSKEDANKQAIELLEKVRISLPEQRAKEYPHQISGGMRQRVMIAMALACAPELLIADEPTTALDVTIQAQVLELLRQLNRDTGTGIILITHDLGVVAEVCDKVAVMYLGHIVESAATADLFQNPMHPYTKGLLASIPKITEEKVRLITIEGTVPNPLNKIEGCKFSGRCPMAMEKCRKAKPEAVGRDGHLVRCFLYE